MGDILFIDYETRSKVDLQTRGADIYARDASTDVMAFGWAFDDLPVQVNPIFSPPPPDVTSHVKNGGIVVAHNATFEWLIWNYVWRRVYPSIPILSISQCRCTMVMSYAMGLPGSLEKASAAAGLDMKKDMKGNRVMIQLSQPKKDGTFYEPITDDEKFEQMYKYCETDIDVERKLYKRLLPLSAKEQALWELDHKINQRGVAVDYASALQAISIVDFEKKRLDEEMRKVTNNEVSTCSANAQLTTFLRNSGVQTEGVAKHIVSDLLEKDKLPQNCRAALLYRQEAAKSSTAKFVSLIERSGTDHRMRSTLQYHGAGTGRWAGRGFQLHNLPRPRLAKEEIQGVFAALT